MCETPQDLDAQYNDDMARYLRGNEVTWSHEDEHDNDDLYDLPYELNESGEDRWDRYWESQGDIHSRFPE